MIRSTHTTFPFRRVKPLNGSTIVKTADYTSYKYNERARIYVFTFHILLVDCIGI